MPIRVAVFTPYPFAIGEKINISQGHRQGDWVVVGIDDRKVTLRCPVSGKEYSWDKFCYLVATQERVWPEVTNPENLADRLR